MRSQTLRTNKGGSMFDNGTLVKVLVTVAVTLGLYDAYEMFKGKVDPNRHAPFLLAGVLFAFAIMIVMVNRRTLTPEQHAERQHLDALKKATESLEPFED